MDESSAALATTINQLDGARAGSLAINSFSTMLRCCVKEKCFLAELLAWHKTL